MKYFINSILPLITFIISQQSSYGQRLDSTERTEEKAETLRRWVMPLEHWEVTSGFGYRYHPVSGRYAAHKGIDLRANQQKVRSAAKGLVTAIGQDRYLGRYIVVDHGQGIVTLYGHLSAEFIKEGDQVAPGQLIAISGSTGRVSGPHLHFGMYMNGTPIDPKKLILLLATPSAVSAL